MRLGLHINSFPWAINSNFGSDLAKAARQAEDAGFYSISVMDHFFQVPNNGQVDDAMLEAYVTLGFLAAQTSKIRIGAIVSGAMGHHPGLLIKQVTSLDVLSAGRAFLGVGAAYYEREYVGLGVPFAPISERFERLEETLQIAHHMWQGSAAPYEGKYYQLAEPVNYPHALQRPHPPIWVGGSGEQKTLKLVAKYGDACNLGRKGSEALKHKLEILRTHCETLGRDYSSIMKTVQFRLDVGPNGESANQMVDELCSLQELGFDVAIAALSGIDNPDRLAIVGRDVIPKIAGVPV